MRVRSSACKALVCVAIRGENRGGCACGVQVGRRRLRCGRDWSCWGTGRGEIGLVGILGRVLKD